ncbi:MAG: polysaccharide biosynthesis protein [Acutalibacteraceae bacterium]
MKNRYFVLFSSILFDLIAAIASFFLAFKIVGEEFFSSGKDLFYFTFLVWPVLIIFSNHFFRIYCILWRFSRLSDLIKVFAAVSVAAAALFVVQMAVFSRSYQLEIFFITLFLTFFIELLCRLGVKYNSLRSHEKKAEKTGVAPTELSGNIMIIGAGSAASMIINELNSGVPFSHFKIKCAIDDDPAKKGSYISGVRVVGGRESIIEAVEKFEIGTILFAIPSCTSAQKFELLNICQQTDCMLKIIPSIYELIESGEKDLSKKIRKVEIEDLLGRDPITFDMNSVLNYVSGKTVLVTGGGGTIGSELCRQISEHSPKRLIVFDIYENNAYDIQNELKRKFPELNLITLIGSVRDSRRIESVFRDYRPDIVYHAAAHKHVPLMEESPNESIKNNVFGTLKTVQCADKYGAEKFVLISTDKAVNPTNIMGASKRICEMIIQSYNSRSATEFVAVRFGNVLGSNGSVIPLFKRQIEAGGPVTVTDPNIIRFFMTIPEAVTLVLQAGALAKGGEIFVLDMGKPVKILTLAENLIKLSGLTPYKDINIEFIGLRPGEKLYEEMLMAEEGLQDTENGMIHIGKPIEYDENEFFKTLDQMKNCMYDDTTDIRALVKKIVPTYNYINN